MSNETLFSEIDHFWMQRALKLARSAARLGEVPVGAVLVKDHKIIAAGFNRPISQSDPTAHAEIVCLRRAAQKLHNYRLVDTTLYVTLEPCFMCAGAILHARVARVVFAAPDLKLGAAGSVDNIFAAGRSNHYLNCEGGLCAAEAVQMLQEFFRARR